MKLWAGEVVSYDGLAWTVAGIDNMNWDGQAPRTLELHRGEGSSGVTRLVSEAEID